MITGGCFCGEIRYGIDDGNYTVANCHCGMCRRTSAAAYVTWIVVPVDNFRISDGSFTELKSSDAGTRYFCNQCGTPIACVNTDHPQIIDVTHGSLDDPFVMQPTIEIHTDSRLPWVSDLSHLKIV